MLFLLREALTTCGKMSKLDSLKNASFAEEGTNSFEKMLTRDVSRGIFSLPKQLVFLFGGAYATD